MPSLTETGSLETNLQKSDCKAFSSRKDKHDNLMVYDGVRIGNWWERWEF